MFVETGGVSGEVTAKAGRYDGKVEKIGAGKFDTLRPKMLLTLKIGADPKSVVTGERGLAVRASSTPSCSGGAKGGACALMVVGVARQMGRLFHARTISGR